MSNALSASSTSPPELETIMEPDLYYFCSGPDRINKATGKPNLIPVSKGYVSEVEALRDLYHPESDLIHIVVGRDALLYRNGKRVIPDKKNSEMVLAECRELRMVKETL